MEFSCEGYEFINEADTAGREILLSVESFIAGVLDYETGMFQLVLGSWDKKDAEKTVITEVG